MNAIKSCKLPLQITVSMGMAGMLGLCGTYPALAATLPYLSGAAQTYVVLYKANAVPSDAAKVIANAGGESRLRLRQDRGCHCAIGQRVLSP